MPFSSYDEDNPEIIDEVFRRINSNGKHLSRQEIRQAGATGEFAELVRVLSTKLRRDVSHEDVLLLEQMKDISIKQDGNGYVLIGVADKLEDAEKISRKYGVENIRVGNFYITGVDGEVEQFYNGDYDKYFSQLKNALQQMPIDEHYRRLIGTKMRMVSYYNRSVIIIKIVNDNGAVMFDNGYYTRVGANNDPEPVSAPEMPAFFAKFN